MKAPFNQPFVPVGQDGVRQRQLRGGRIGDIGAPAQRLLLGGNGGGWLADRRDWVAHRNERALRPVGTPAPRAEMLAGVAETADHPNLHAL